MKRVFGIMLVPLFAFSVFLSGGFTMTGRRSKRWLMMMTAVLGCLFAASPAPADEPFRYFVNEFGIVGLKDYNRGTRITPYNRLTMVGDGYATEHEPDATVQMRFGRDLRLVGLEPTKTLVDGWIPVSTCNAADGKVLYEFTLWATPLPSVKDWQKAYDRPTEGENFLTWILVKATNTGAALTEAKFSVEQCGNYSKQEHPVPSLAEPEEFTWSLVAGESAEGVVRLPWYPLKDAHAFDKEDHNLWLNRTIRYWRDLMAKAAVIEVPCEKANQAFKSSLTYQMIVLDNGQVKAGESVYDAFWMRDGAYQIMQLEESGFFEIARKALHEYFPYQRSDGIFQSQQGQLDSNGQTPWAFWQYYKITGDRRWLKDVYPRMRRAADWTIKARRQAPPNSPFAGLLPKAIGEGEFFCTGDEHHVVGADLWNLRGLLITADAARILGKTKEADKLLAEARDYRAAIDAAHKRTGVSHFPPAWEDVGDKLGICYTHWGNAETLWPTELFRPDDPRVTAMITELRERHGGGYAEGLVRFTTGIVKNKVSLPQNPMIVSYNTMYTTLADMIRGNHEQVVEDFYWQLLHTTASNMFGECIIYNERLASADTIPHVVGASMYTIMMRHMLIHERGDVLHLLWAVPDWWLGDGEQIRIERAPTHFGKMSLTIRGTADGVLVDFDPPIREKPSRIILHLPESRPLVKPVEGIEVVTRADQKKRWDWPTIVKTYQQRATPLFDLVYDKFTPADIAKTIALLESTEENWQYFFDQQCWDHQTRISRLVEKLRAFAETPQVKESDLADVVAQLELRAVNCLKLLKACDPHNHQYEVLNE